MKKQEVPWLVMSRLKCFSWVHPPDCDQAGISLSLFKHEFGLSQSFVPTDGTGSTRVCCNTQVLTYPSI